MRKFYVLSTVVFLLHVLTAQAQSVAINDNGSAPHPSAMLDVNSFQSSKGLLVPRVALTATNVAAPVAAPATALLVYNTATEGSGATAVSPGFYHWDGSAWVRGIASGDAALKAWALGGNMGTNPATHFLGTTDNQPLVFKVNNEFAGSISPSSGNLSMGYLAGSNLATGGGNTAIGVNALLSTTTGGANTATGLNALRDNIGGAQNTATGVSALQANTSGTQNTATGVNALLSNTVGFNNTAAGFNALRSNTEGNDNTATGVSALFRNTTGVSNTATGTNALFINTIGFDNTATGVNALQKNSSGAQNTATGVNALIENTNGVANTAMGVLSLAGNTSGSSNTATGNLALRLNTTGQSNTAQGHSALTVNTTGNFNTAIGASANVSTGALDNATALGARSRVDCNNCLVLGSVNGVNGAASSVRVGIGVNSPHASAVLDLTSSSAGLLTPRMSQAQRDAIATPAVGLILYQTDGTAGFYYYNGTAWTALAGGGSSGWNLSGNAGTSPATHFIGTTDAQPLVFKVDNTFAGSVSPLTNNQALGYKAGIAMTTGTANTATGYQALLSNTEGSSNTATGAGALQQNVSGNSNTAMGVNALFTNGSGTENTAVGRSSLALNTTGINNTAMGAFALFTNSEGSNNTAYGHRAMFSNTLGFSNTAIGRNALQNNLSGFLNTAVGMGALQSNTGGTDNTAIGQSAMVSNTSGRFNTAIGVGALHANINGSQNTAIGENALDDNTSGLANTAVGANSGVSAGNLENTTAIGVGAIVNANNKVRLGNNAVTVVESSGTFTTVSDGRFKYNVREDVSGLDFILRLRPVTYQFDVNRMDAHMRGEPTEKNDIMQASYKEATALRRTGFIAQEVERAARASGYNFSGINRPQLAKDHYSLSYESFVVPLVKAVQEQQALIEQQNDELKKLKEQVEALTKAVQNLSSNR